MSIYAGVEWNGSLTTKSEDFDAGVEELNTQLDEALKKLTADPSKPDLLAKYQSRLSEYTLYRQAQTNVVKIYKDVAAGIIANMRT